MWDDHQRLNQIATLLYALALIAVVYTLVMIVIRQPVFAVRELAVTEPVAHTTRSQVEVIAREQLRGTFFTVDLEAVRRAFEKLPWVRKATLRRAWPDRLEVALEEHVPLARWKDTGLVNTHGEVFEAASDLKLPVFRGPVGTAAEMTARHRAFSAILVAIGRRPVELRLSERRAWQLELDNGDVLELGREALRLRLERFTAVYARTVGKLPPKRYRIDLRYPNGFALRVPDKSSGGGHA